MTGPHASVLGAKRIVVKVGSSSISGANALSGIPASSASRPADSTALLQVKL